MDRILKILKKENGPRASSAPALELNNIIFKHVYWYMQQISGERLQDHWSSGLFEECGGIVVEHVTTDMRSRFAPCCVLEQITLTHRVQIKSRKQWLQPAMIKPEDQWS